MPDPPIDNGPDSVEAMEATLIEQAAEIARLKDGIRYWAYCMNVGMRETCPEKVGELADFLISCKIAPYFIQKVD